MELTDTDEECNGCDKEHRKSHSKEHQHARVHTHSHTQTRRLHFKDCSQNRNICLDAEFFRIE